MARPRGDADHSGCRGPDEASGGQIVRAAAVLGALAVGIVATDVAAAGPHIAARSAAGSALQVTEVEYRLLLSRGVVKAGPVDLEAIDGGMDPHDLRLRHGRSPAATSVPQLNAGQRWDGVVLLRPGVYHLWCSLPGHWRLGMRATLHVVR